MSIKHSRAAWSALAFSLLLSAPAVKAATALAPQSNQAPAAEIMNTTTATFRLANGQLLYVDFYGDNIFRVFRDPAGGMLRDPEAKPEARILDQFPRRVMGTRLSLNGNKVRSAAIEVAVDTQTGQLKVTNLKTGKTVIEEVKPAIIEKNHTELTLKAQPGEYFYGGGVQNGRFSHRGKSIQIVNTNNWTDGGVASPAPFYWSTGGYGVMPYTFMPGRYDFAAADKSVVKVMHETDYEDVFFMVDDTPVALLNDFWQLTGHPVLLPKFGFYEGHLNAYNRDYWKEATKEGEGTLFEDGKHYTESQKNNGGTKESLNGEKQNYQFSARAVIDRYAAHDMPLGWILPNDGYGAGYGQTGSLDGNIQNLKDFGDYARSKGVQIGLWTQSDLHPKAGVEPLLQRDIIKEVGTAGVRVLKTDVAWVGAGYSFGLNGVSDVAGIMPYYGHDARPFIISLDGWAGTQRYAGIWSGDQTGGNWEYIRFHIPTYIGSGLSGQPNITSDMDGIFGGKNVPVNVRDFQWKTFTPMQLNMDGWGANAKYPHILGEPAASINRTYLKLKSELIPYIYSVAHEAVEGKPMIRAMFLDDANAYTLGSATEYQYLFGPYFLVAPIYKETQMDKEGNDVRNGIYLPAGKWIDYFTGDVYEGGRIINNFNAPLWKLPLFVKAGAIIPMANANNNVSQIDKSLRRYEIYPDGKSEFTEYEDDGTTQAYLHGEAVTTKVTVNCEKDKATINIEPSAGHCDGFVENKSTEMCINLTAQPKKVTAKIGGKNVKLTAVASKAELESGSNVYFYDATPNLNQFATAGSAFAQVKMTKNPQLLVRLAATNVRTNGVELTVNGFTFAPADNLLKSRGTLTAPKATVTDKNTQAYQLTPSWDKVANADYYEVEFNGMNYSTITDTQLTFDGLQPKSDYSFKVRAVNADGQSAWSTLTAQTKSNPLEFAIHGVTGKTSCDNQGGQGINKFFDFDETDVWHSKWGDKGTAVPFTIDINLNSINKLDKMQYLPREDAGNGTWMEGTVSYSSDKTTWSTPIPFQWNYDGKVKELVFKDQPTAQYVKISVTKAQNNFGSGRELYFFKVPGSETILPGDINHDGKIDMDDFTSYMNYTGLRKGDSDFDGYVSGGDINHNDLIDAYDISVVGTHVRGGVDTYGMKPLKGTLTLQPDKTTYKAGDEINVTVKGTGMQAVNAFSFALPYNPSELEYTGIETVGTKEMENLTNDRLHTNGTKALYPTFVNTGDKDVIEGDGTLFVLKFKAKRSGKFMLKAKDIMLVDKGLNVK
jgi:alpha-glucosidase (family GH31 glycosyl hydrolase)